MPKYDKYAYDQKYLKENIKCKRVVFNLTSDSDKEMMKWIDERPEGISGYIKKLIAEDMKKAGQ